MGWSPVLGKSARAPLHPVCGYAAFPAPARGVPRAGAGCGRGPAGAGTGKQSLGRDAGHTALKSLPAHATVPRNRMSAADLYGSPAGPARRCPLRTCQSSPRTGWPSRDRPAQRRPVTAARLRMLAWFVSGLLVSPHRSRQRLPHVPGAIKGKCDGPPTTGSIFLLFGLSLCRSLGLLFRLLLGLLRVVTFTLPFLLAILVFLLLILLALAFTLTLSSSLAFPFAFATLLPATVSAPGAESRPRKSTLRIHHVGVRKSVGVEDSWHLVSVLDSIGISPIILLFHLVQDVLKILLEFDLGDVIVVFALVLVANKQLGLVRIGILFVLLV
mmetsp:Transcript_52569/g.139547  ORF Transcript_52569/g.139547 Transcript_52569/m.139547 type:complete len:328 (-) Transcript_52569:446-1429(-)